MLNIGKVRARKSLTEPETSENRRANGPGNQQQGHLFERFARQD
ncbi:hypothetical protein [Streptomyces sp. H27-H5]|nr:hypothetical protein [Streptomyces sp. H27-H5]MCY0961623.1 hypothetical protein [Streptomyces sp. H27-H5]